jgi:hypothetical protein
VRIAASLVIITFVTGAFAPGADAGRRKKKPKKEDVEEVVKLPSHPRFGVPVYEGAREASERTIRGLGLDSFEGYRVGLFFTNSPAIEVAKFYIRALRRTVKKEQSETGLRYTLMIAPPSAQNPLGEKVVVDESEGGVKDESGEVFKTSIAVYRKDAAKKP